MSDDSGQTSRWVDRLRMLTDSRLELIHDRFAGTSELFDLALDPEERHDVSAERVEVVAALLARLSVFESDAMATEAADERSDEERATLRALGYVEDGR